MISIDTRKAEVMRQAAAAGADVLNDVSAFTHDPEALEVAADSGLPVVLMHAQGDPKTMNDNPQYDDVVLDVFDYLESRVQACVAAGIPKAKIVADPGIGFGKHLHHNVAVMAGLSLYHGLGVPILLGASRKKMIGQLCDVDGSRGPRCRARSPARSPVSPRACRSFARTTSRKRNRRSRSGGRASPGLKRVSMREPVGVSAPSPMQKRSAEFDCL